MTSLRPTFLPFLNHSWDDERVYVCGCTNESRADSRWFLCPLVQKNRCSGITLGEVFSFDSHCAYWSRHRATAIEIQWAHKDHMGHCSQARHWSEPHMRRMYLLSWHVSLKGSTNIRHYIFLFVRFKITFFLVRSCYFKVDILTTYYKQQQSIHQL